MLRLLCFSTGLSDIAIIPGKTGNIFLQELLSLSLIYFLTSNFLVLHTSMKNICVLSWILQTNKRSLLTFSILNSTLDFKISILFWCSFAIKFVSIVLCFNCVGFLPT